MCIIVLKTLKYLEKYVFNVNLKILMGSLANIKIWKEVYLKANWNSETRSVPYSSNSIKLQNCMYS